VEPSAFRDRDAAPGESQLEAMLGPAHKQWHALKARLAGDFAPLAEEWSFAGKGRGWSLRLAVGRRPLVYLTPLPGRCRASLALPERAMPAAIAADLPPAICSLVAAAPSYPEGRAIRMEVLTDGDVAAVIALVRIRMAS
jgi:hypothetical protein